MLFRSICFRTLVGVLCKVSMQYGATEINLLLVRSFGVFGLALATCTLVGVHPFGDGQQNELLLLNGSIGGLTAVATTMAFSHLSLLLSNIIPVRPEFIPGKLFVDACIALIAEFSPYSSCPRPSSAPCWRTCSSRSASAATW
jgi:hypothetical protein